MCQGNSFVWLQRGPKWEKQPVPCRKCWQCRQLRFNDYVGRSLAEAAYSERVCTLTLTYAPRDDLADRVLHPRHFQLFMKLLRRAGHKVRYLVAGEYGDLRGRAHFHAILFFQHLASQEPHRDYYNRDHLADPWASNPFSDQIPQMRMSHIREWPHGHVLADWNSDERSIRYVCKYILKDTERKESWFSLSKKPPLGAAFFAEKAETARASGVLPSTWNYLPPGADKARRYPITGATRRDYLNAVTQDPNDKPRMSEWTLKTFEKHERARLLDYLNSLSAEVQEKAFLDRRQAEEDQAALMRLGAKLREASELNDDMLRSANGILRFVGGRWTPNEKETDHE